MFDQCYLTSEGSPLTMGDSVCRKVLTNNLNSLLHFQLRLSQPATSPTSFLQMSPCEVYAPSVILLKLFQISVSGQNHCNSELNFVELLLSGADLVINYLIHSFIP